MLSKDVDGLLRILITKCATIDAFQTLEEGSKILGNARFSIADVCRHGEFLENFLDDRRIDIGFIRVREHRIYVRLDVIVGEVRYCVCILGDGVEYAHEEQVLQQRTIDAGGVW